MVIRSARPQAAGITQNNPLETNGPKVDLSKVGQRALSQYVGKYASRN